MVQANDTHACELEWWQALLATWRGNSLLEEPVEIEMFSDASNSGYEDTWWTGPAIATWYKDGVPEGAGVHKHKGVVSGLKNGGSFPEVEVNSRVGHSLVHGQSGHLSDKNGGKEGAFKGDCGTNLGPLRGARRVSDGGVYRREAKRNRGQAVQDRGGRFGVETGSGGVRITAMAVGAPYCGFLRVQGQHPATKVRYVEGGRAGDIRRRFGSLTGKGEWVREPPAIIGKVLQRLYLSSRSLTLIVSAWPARLWWPMAMHMLVDVPVLLPDYPGIMTPTFQKGEKVPVLPWRYSALRISGRSSSRKAFRARLRRHFCLDGQALRTVITSWCGSDGRSTAGAERAVDSILNNLM